MSFKILRRRRSDSEPEPELVSSFGLTLSESKAEIERYALAFDEGLEDKLTISFVELKSGIYGRCNQIFNDDDKPVGYHVYIDTSRLDAAKTRKELDAAFVQGIVTAGHEVHHAQQFESKDPEMALSHLAAIGNEQNCVDNYAFNRREIAAEDKGIVVAMQYLQHEHPGVDGESMLLDYINGFSDRRGTKPDDRKYFVETPESGEFSSVSEALDAFDEAYDAAKSHVNVYKYKIGPSCADDFAKLAEIDRKRVIDALYDTQDSMSSNMVLSAATLWGHPRDAREVTDVDLPVLTTEEVFGRSFSRPDEMSDRKPDYGSKHILQAMENAANVNHDANFGVNGPDLGV